MRKYKLRAGKRNAQGVVTQLSIDAEILAADDTDAIKMAKMY